MKFYRAIVECEKNVYREAPKQVLNHEIDKIATVWVDESWRYRTTSINVYDEDCWEDAKYFRHSIIIACDNNSMSMKIPNIALDKALEYWDSGKVISRKIDEAALVNDIWSDGPIPSEVSKRGNFLELRKIPPTSNFWDDWVLQTIESKTKCLMRAKTCIHKNNLADEIKNIYDTDKPNEEDFAIPVHYILEGSNNSKIRESVDCLANALVATKRARSKHIIWLNLDSEPELHRWYEEIVEINNDNFAHVLEGNIVVIDYGRKDNGSTYDMGCYKHFTKLLSNLSPYLDDTQLLFVVPDNKKFVRDKIEKLLKLPVVYIENEHFKNIEKARDQINLEKATEAIRELYPQYTQQLDKAQNINDLKVPSSMEKLDALIGLDSVKAKIKEILNRYKMNEILSAKGLESQPFNMNMAFMGSPGTGKTIVAHLVGDILKEAGVLKEGRVIEVSGAGYWDPEKIFKAAKGSVLFVDEAYAMMGDPNKIASFIALMETNRDDTVVIIGGYKNDIKSLLSCNVGFASRFSNMVYFEDYTEAELLEIFDFMLEQRGFTIEEAARKQIREILCRAGRRPDHGNARFVRQLVEDCIGKQQNRLAAKYSVENKTSPTKKTLSKITTQDISDKYLKLADKSAEDDLEKLIGLQTVKDKIVERINYCAVQSARRDLNLETEFIPMHMAFLGSPGTGKTEVSKIIGRLLNEKGLLSVGDFMSINGSIIASAQPPDIASLFQSARGSILFVDEAYSMIANPVNVGIFIDKMDEYRSEIVVVLAGYTKEINALFASNPGFRSRVKNIINFPDYTIEELVQIAALLLTKDGYIYDKKVLKKIEAVCKKAYKKSAFGNGRFVRNLVENAYIKQGNRIAPTIDKLSDAKKKKALQTILPEDIVDDFDTSDLGTSRNNLGFVKG